MMTCRQIKDNITCLSRHFDICYVGITTYNTTSRGPKTFPYKIYKNDFLIEPELTFLSPYLKEREWTCIVLFENYTRHVQEVFRTQKMVAVFKTHYLYLVQEYEKLFYVLFISSPRIREAVLRVNTLLVYTFLPCSRKQSLNFSPWFYSWSAIDLTTTRHISET